MQAKAPAVRRGLFYCASKIKTFHGPEKQPGGHKEQGRAALALSRRPYADQLFHVRKHSFIGYRYHQPAAAVERAGRVVQLPHRRRAEGQQRLCRHGFPLADAHKAGERAGRRVQGTQCAASLFVFYIPARRHPAAAVFDARHRAGSPIPASCTVLSTGDCPQTLRYHRVRAFGSEAKACSMSCEYPPFAIGVSSVAWQAEHVYFWRAPPASVGINSARTAMRLNEIHPYNVILR